jgi:hypothetical protein
MFEKDCLELLEVVRLVGVQLSYSGIPQCLNPNAYNVLEPERQLEERATSKSLALQYCSFFYPTLLFHILQSPPYAFSQPSHQFQPPGPTHSTQLLAIYHLLPDIVREDLLKPSHRSSAHANPTLSVCQCSRNGIVTAEKIIKRRLIT